MCQISKHEINGKVKGYIQGHLGEMKCLSAWQCEINTLLPRNRGYAPKGLAHLFAVFRKKGFFRVERKIKKNNYIIYCFY